METALQLVRESLSTLPRQHTPRAMVLEMRSPAPQPHSPSCTWELVRNANSQALPQT